MKKTSIIASALVLLSAILNADITIKNGWQLLGATQDINASIFDSTCVDYVWKYDATDINNAQWQVHIANAVAYNNTMTPITSLVKGEGYWVKGNYSAPCTIASAETVLLEAIVETSRYTRDANTSIVTDHNQRIERSIDGTIRYFDKRMWQDTTPEAMTWDTAHGYCAALTLGGYADWRLPTPEELVETVEGISPVFKNTLNVPPAGNLSMFDPYGNQDTTPLIQPGFFWSLTTSAYNAGIAVHVHLVSGDQNYEGKAMPMYVRCVRAGQ